MATAHAFSDWLLLTTAHAALVAACILAATTLFRRWLSPSARYALWGLVALRLALPVLPESRWSLSRLVEPRFESVAEGVAPSPAPAVERGWVVKRGGLAGFEPPATSVPSTPAPVRSFPWRPVLLLVWLAGALSLLSAVIVSNYRLARRLRGARRISDPDTLSLLRACGREMGVRVAPPLLETDAVYSPALAGFVSPKLLLPPGLVGRLTRAELRFVFLHELAHLKRRDILADWLLTLLQVVHWFNPVVWFAFARCRAERELARDAMVLSVGRPADYAGYGRTILRVLEGLSRRTVPVGTVGMLEETGQLKRRIAMIANYRRSSRLALPLSLGVALLIACVAFTDAPRPAKPAASNQPSSPVSSGRPAESAKSAPLVPDLVSADAAAETKERKLPAPPPADPEDEKMRRTLDLRLPEVRFEQVALNDVIDYLRDVTNANIFVNWRSIEAAGIERDVPVTARLRDVRFSKALETILADASHGAKLGFAVDDGVITIAAADELNQNVAIHVYDIRDLLAVVAGKDGDDPAAVAKRQEKVAAEIMALIQATVDRDSWVDDGGSLGAMKLISGQLVVTQTPENHKALIALLEKLRESRALQIGIETRFITVPRTMFEDGGLDKALFLDPNESLRAEPAADPARPAAGRPFNRYLDDGQVAELLKAVQSSKESEILSAPKVTLFNAQNGTITMGAQQAYIADYGPVKLDGRRDPTVATVETGISLDFLPVLSAGRDFVTLSLHPKISALKKLDEVAWPKAGEGEQLTVQKPDIDSQEVKTVVAIPEGKSLALLLGRRGDADKVVFLLVKPTILVQPKGERKQFPLLITRPEPKR